MHIDDYEYGRIVIDGREERKDVILTRSRIYPNWWRKEGHALSLEDLDPVVTQRPGVLVVGTGTAGNMRPDPELEDALEALGIGIEAMQTAEAVRRFNELIGLGDVEVAAALHLTC